MNSLHLTTLGANMTEIRYGSNYVLFSYQTPVAYMNEAQELFVTAKKYSNTTSKHVSKWLNGRSATKIDQAVIDNLVK